MPRREINVNNGTFLGFTTKVFFWTSCRSFEYYGEIVVQNGTRGMFCLRYDSKHLCDEFSTVVVSCTGLFAYKIGEFKFVVLRLCPHQLM